MLRRMLRKLVILPNLGWVLCQMNLHNHVAHYTVHPEGTTAQGYSACIRKNCGDFAIYNW